MSTDRPAATARRTAFVVVDAQYDFTEVGSLPVAGGLGVCERIADELRARHVDVVFSTYDWHPAEAPFHFAGPGEEPDFQDRWPPHCVAGTDGATNPPVLDRALQAVDAIRVYKGQHAAAYSGFEGHAGQDGDGPGLAELLDERGVTDVVIGGLALDFCVRATALDALAWAARGDRDVTVRLDLTAAVDPANADRVAGELAAAGAHVASGS